MSAVSEWEEGALLNMELEVDCTATGSTIERSRHDKERERELNYGTIVCERDG